jgi:hypothetical protein
MCLSQYYLGLSQREVHLLQGLLGGSDNKEDSSGDEGV